jgi:hypothetical protein
MPKPLRQRWFLQYLVEQEVARLAPDLPIAPVLQNDDEQIVWDEECEGLGRASWTCCYLIPQDHPARALLPMLNAAIAPLQACYDLGLTCR